MAKKRDHRQSDSKRKNDKGLSRRAFLKTGAAAGLAAPALLQSACSTDAAGITWDYEADIVIAGGGCAGLTAAIRARDLGASVIVIDQNFDLGGRMLHSGSFVSFGGGDPVQRRDMKGEHDKEGFITVAPVEGPEELDDSIDLLFTDITDWSVLDRRGQSPYRYNERELVRAWAENCPATRQFLMDNYVRFARINGTHGGGGLSRARGAVCFLMRGDKTDIKAGTITAEDAGVADPERTSPFAPVQMTNASRFAAPNALSNGVASRDRSSFRPARKASSSSCTAVSTSSYASNRSRAGFSESKPAIHRGSIRRRASFCAASGRTAISTSSERP